MLSTYMFCMFPNRRCWLHFFRRDAECHLTKEYHTKFAPYTGSMEVVEIKGCKINWKAGKDVTVERAKVGKKSKTGKSKKQDPRFFCGCSKCIAIVRNCDWWLIKFELNLKCI